MIAALYVQSDGVYAMHGFIEHVYPGRFRLGDDKGCFAPAPPAFRDMLLTIAEYTNARLAA